MNNLNRSQLGLFPEVREVLSKLDKIIKQNEEILAVMKNQDLPPGAVIILDLKSVEEGTLYSYEIYLAGVSKPRGCDGYFNHPLEKASQIALEFALDAFLLSMPKSITLIVPDYLNQFIKDNDLKSVFRGRLSQFESLEVRAMTEDNPHCRSVKRRLAATYERYRKELDSECSPSQE